LTIEDPLLHKPSEVTVEDGMTTVQVGDSMPSTENHELRYGEHRFTNPLKTSVDVVNQERLSPSLPVAPELLSEHRKNLKNLCQSTNSTSSVGLTNYDKT
jgi:hypothetical protein